MSPRVAPSHRVTVGVLLVVVLAGCSSGFGTVTDTTPETTLEATTSHPTANDPAGNLSVHFIHVGQGTSVLVVGPTGETLLYDTGNWNDDGDHVLDYLRAQNVTRIDYLVTSHADADHVGGHAEVIDYYESRAGGVGAIYDPGIAAATRTYEAYLDAVEEHNVTLYRTHAGDEILMADVSVQVLSPPEDYLAERDRNENSLVLGLSYENVSVLLTGDAENQAERYLTDTYGEKLDATILAAGHHGSNTSTGHHLLAATTPRVVAIQSAYDSPYGHPHQELLGRLAERGIPTYWTGVHGTVSFETDGNQVVVSTQRGAPTAPEELRTVPGVEPESVGLLEPRMTFTAGSGERPAVRADGGTDSTVVSRSLVVTEIHADAAGDDRVNRNDEYVVFRNAGGESLDLSGWTVSDEADHRYTVPEGTTVAPDETVTLHTGRGTDTETDLYWNADGAVWNNDGDTVFIRTAEGTLVLETSYDG